MENIEVLNQEVKFQGKVFDVRQDQVRLPGGQVVRLDIVSHADSVTLVPVDEQGQIWFISQYRHPTGSELLELPAGVTEPDETAEETARREIREEIGMAAGNLQYLGKFYLAPGYTTELMHVYLATELSSSPLAADEDEILRVEKISVSEALRMAEKGEIHDGKTISALFLARPYLS